MAGKGKRDCLKTRQGMAPLEISEILATTERGLWVRIKATGDAAWLPRSQTQIRPGLAIVPTWLARKLCPQDGGKEATR